MGMYYATQDHNTKKGKGRGARTDEKSSVM